MLEEKIKNIIDKTKGKKVSQNLAYDGTFIKVFKEQYIYPNGKNVIKERIIKNKGKNAVIVITRTINNKYVLVVQNRVDENVSIEWPSGYIEENEEVEKASKREVQEETGYIGDEAVVLDSVISSIGTENSKTFIAFIDNAKKQENQNLDEDEFVNYIEVTFDELTYLIDKKYILSSSNKLAYYHLKEILERNN